MNPWLELQQAQQRREAHIANAAKRAQLAITYTTTGTGELVTAQPVAFPTPFLYEPAVTTGHALAQVLNRSVYGLPRVTCGVLRWQQNPRNFYVGAFLYFVIEVPLVGGEGATTADAPPPPRPTIHHHLEFTSVSYKPLTADATEPLTHGDLPTNMPRG